MKLTFKVGEIEHWFDVKDTVIFTRKLTRDWYEPDFLADDGHVLGQLADWVTGCHLVDTQGVVYEDLSEMTPETLDNFHPAVLRWLYNMPSYAYEVQSHLGEASGKR